MMVTIYFFLARRNEKPQKKRIHFLVTGVL